MAASGIEVNLPDLPELSIGLGPDDGPRLTPGEAGLAHRRRPWGPRLRDALTTYLPFLLMVILALGSWWLVKNSPGAPKSTRAAVPAGVPDYTLHGFTLQRYGKDGRLMLTLHGRQ